MGYGKEGKNDVGEALKFEYGKGLVILNLSLFLGILLFQLATACSRYVGRESSINNGLGISNILQARVDLVHLVPVLFGSYAPLGCETVRAVLGRTHHVIHLSAQTF